MRFLAGVASPLVPSLMYILERATEEGASKLAGVNAYSASVNFAYAFAGMIVGLFYSELGWTGLNLFSAAVAALALSSCGSSPPRTTITVAAMALALYWETERRNKSAAATRRW